MPNVTPLKREDLQQFEDIFRMVEAAMGFVPTSLCTMAHRPELMQAFLGLVSTIQMGSQLDPVLGQLVAYVSSTAAGCRYCQAHTAASAVHLGAGADKLEAAWEFESSSLFSDADRAALRLARDASAVPNATTPAHFEELRRYYSDRQIIDLVAVISLFGFLNRWNDTMATQLEEPPRQIAEQVLGRHGWNIGKHGPEA